MRSLAITVSVTPAADLRRQPQIRASKATQIRNSSTPVRPATSIRFDTPNGTMAANRNRCPAAGSAAKDPIAVTAMTTTTQDTTARSTRLSWGMNTGTSTPQSSPLTSASKALAATRRDKASCPASGIMRRVLTLRRRRSRLTAIMAQSQASSGPRGAPYQTTPAVPMAATRPPIAAEGTSRMAIMIRPRRNAICPSGSSVTGGR